MAKKRANGEGNIRKRKDGRWEGCPYWRGIVCVSCYKKLLKEHFAGR